jgi:hypothetical protein
MKKIRLLLLIPTLFILLSGTVFTQKGGKPLIIEITKHSTKSYLDSLTAALKKKGIVLKLNKIAFNDAGQLQKIAGRIQFAASCFGTFSTDSLEKIVIEKKQDCNFSINKYLLDKTERKGS